MMLAALAATAFLAAAPAAAAPVPGEQFPLLVQAQTVPLAPAEAPSGGVNASPEPAIPRPQPLSRGQEAGEGSAPSAALNGLSEARWLAPGTEISAYLAAAPAECLSLPASEDAAWRVEAGRALFRSPLALGGTAARYGLSCGSCHRNGRDNPHFFLDGLSGAPGTADTTSALFSKMREDGVFNPKPIPDLVGAGAKATLGSTGAFHDLEGFIAGAVADEFQGEATSGVVEALAAYVRALKPEACGAAEPPGPAALADFRRAIAATDAALAKKDRAVADALFLAALQDLKRLDERAAPLPTQTESIRALAADLTAAREAAARSPKKGRKALKRLLSELPAFEAEVRKVR